MLYLYASLNPSRNGHKFGIEIGLVVVESSILVTVVVVATSRRVNDHYQHDHNFPLATKPIDMSLWVDKHRPRTLDKLTYNTTLTQSLKAIVRPL